MYRLSYVTKLLILMGVFAGSGSPILAAEPLLHKLLVTEETRSEMILAVTPIVPIEEQEQVLLHGVIYPDCNCLTIGEVVAIIGGGVVGGATADFILGSAPFAVIGIVAGAALGSVLYRYAF